MDSCGGDWTLLSFRAEYMALPHSGRVAWTGSPDSRSRSAMALKDAALCPRITLGSSSFARRQVMDQLAAENGFRYDVRTAEIDEKSIGCRKSDASALVLQLAHAKALAIKQKLQQAAEDMDGLLITCDQVVCHQGRILEKPTCPEEARAYIDGYGRSPASTVGATVVSDLRTGQTFEDVDVSVVHFNPIPAHVRDALVEEGTVFHCAGGLMVEHELVTPYIARMEGTQDAVMGLAKATVLRLLLEALCAPARM